MGYCMLHTLCRGLGAQNHSKTDYDLELIAQTATPSAPVTSQPLSVNSLKAYKLPSMTTSMMYLPVVPVDSKTNSTMT